MKAYPMDDLVIRARVRTFRRRRLPSFLEGTTAALVRAQVDSASRDNQAAAAHTRRGRACRGRLSHPGCAHDVSPPRGHSVRMARGDAYPWRARPWSPPPRRVPIRAAQKTSTIGGWGRTGAMPAVQRRLSHRRVRPISIAVASNPRRARRHIVHRPWRRPHQRKPGPCGGPFTRDDPSAYRRLLCGPSKVSRACGSSANGGRFPRPHLARGGYDGQGVNVGPKSDNSAG
jgi:hypothetical protein